MDTTAPRDHLRHRLALIGLALLCSALLLVPAPRADASPLSTRIEADDDGLEATIVRPGYRLALDLDGTATFTADDSDVATLSRGGELVLEERIGGVRHRYAVEADRAGALSREYARDGKTMPLDAAGRAWLKAALLRVFRDAGLDAEARARRLLARSPQALLEEIAAIESGLVRAGYLQVAFESRDLDAAQVVRAYALAKDIGSDHELGRALNASLGAGPLDAVRAAALLDAARSIGSDYELAELLVAAAPRLPADAATIAAWRAAVGGVQSDYELRRAIVAAFDGAPPAYRAAALDATASVGSDYELRSALEVAAPRIGADLALLDRYLGCVERIGSDYEQREALTAVARQVAGTPAKARYLAIAKRLGDFERGQALAALADAL